MAKKKSKKKVIPPKSSFDLGHCTDCGMYVVQGNENCLGFGHPYSWESYEEFDEWSAMQEVPK